MPAPKKEPSLSQPAHSGVGKLKPIRLTDQISSVIREQIFAGTLRPGERVVEQKLARQFGVGQNAIREALIELAHSGFVKRVPNIGTYVTQVTADDGRKIAYVRRALEGLVIDLILLRLKQEKLNFSVPAHHLSRMRELLAADQMVAFYESDIEFHRALWSMADNDYLSQLLEQVVVPLFAFFIVVNIHPAANLDNIVKAVDLHEKILNGLIRRSAQEAHAAMCELLDLSQVFCCALSPPEDQ
jgi:DNA-binding GntR family transcriptional regulator